MLIESERRFTRSACLTLLVVFLLIALGAAGLAFLFKLPTDGWLFDNKPGTNYYELKLHFGTNPSILQPGDQLKAINNLAINPDMIGSELAGAWQPGTSLSYTVIRQGVEIKEQIKLENWTFSSALTAMLSQNSGFLGEIAFFIVAVFIFWRRPANAAAQAMFLLAQALVFLGPLVLLSVSIPSVSFFQTLKILSMATILLLYTLIGPPTLVRLTLVFPKPSAIVRRFPTAEAFPYLVGLAVMLLFLATNGIAGYVWTISSLVISIFFLIFNATTMRDAYSRAQLLWGLWGMIVGLGMFLSKYLVLFGGITGPLAELINFFSTLGFGMVGLTLSIAILRYRLFDIALILRRTLQYALLSLLLGLVYFSSVVLLQQVLGSLAGNSSIALVFSTLLIAALFNPLRLRLQDAIDRRFARQRYDAERVLQEFSYAARNEVQLSALTGRLVEVVDTTVQPQGLSLWLREK